MNIRLPSSPALGSEKMTCPETLDEEPLEQQRIGGFLKTYVTGIAIALSGTVLGGEETKKKEPVTKKPVATLKAKDVEKEDPDETLRKLQILAREYSGGLREPKYANKVVPVFQRYLVALKDPQYTLSLPDLESITDIVIHKLYYRNKNIYDEKEGEACKLPFVILDIEAALIDRCREIASGMKYSSKPEELEEKLKRDILWHHFYNKNPKGSCVWQYGAERYIEKCFPGKGSISIADYSEALSKLSSTNAVSCRIVNSSYKRVGLPVIERLKEAKEEDSRDSYFMVVKQLSKLHNLLSKQLPVENSGAKGLSKEEDEIFRTWIS